MRGKGAEGGTNLRNIRITPAYAGKSHTPKYAVRKMTDHPRLCGEKFPFCLPYDAYQGSPPPMRGKDICDNVAAGTKRITPAYAGKSTRSSCRNAQVRDHPRLCGEKLTALHLTSWVPGSPPPMRGKVKTQHDHRLSKGDHPRLCGEK